MMAEMKGQNELGEILKERIRKQGRITFADFMETALYYPELGYYTSSRERVGAGDDFFTSPATHPVFAALISIQLEQMWHLLGCPADFTVVEMGAGKGLLAQDILGYLPRLSPRLAETMKYITTERDKVSVIKGNAETPPKNITGCFLSNELLDALPAHRIMAQDGRIKEIYVTVRNYNFVEVIDDPSTPRLEEQLSQEGIALPEGYRTEVNLNIAPWMEQVAASLKKGFVITIDYGYAAEELYAPARNRGTLMTYYRHNCGSDPYIRIGTQDITTHVDFTAAILAGERRGLDLVALTGQRQFLLNLGIDAFLKALAEKGLSYQEYLANRYSMLELVREEGMGNFKVLIQSKGIATAPLYGIDPDNEKRKTLDSKPLEVPLLRKEHVPLLAAKYPHYVNFTDLPG